MTTPSELPLTTAAALAPSSPGEESNKSWARTRATSIWLPIVAGTLTGVSNAIIGVLLPNQFATLDPASKVVNLAIVTTASVVLSVVTQPLIGALSDRTRGRFGRRAPWIVIGAAGVIVGVVGLSQSVNIVTITLFWALLTIAVNTVQSPLQAVIPDRYEHSRQGRASALLGLGMMVGSVVGTIVASSLAFNLTVGYLAVGALVLLGAIGFVIFAADHPLPVIVKEQLRLRAFFSALWVSPRKYPDFAWAFAARFLYIFGFYVVGSYQFYILTDYIHLTLKQTNGLIAILGVAVLLPALVTVTISGYLSDRLGRRKIFVIVASSTVAVGLLVPLVFPTVAGVLIYAVLSGLGFGIYMSTDNALMIAVLPKATSAAAKDLGILGIASTLPQAIAPAAAAAIILSSWGYPALFIVGFVSVALAAIAMIPIRSVR